MSLRPILARARQQSARLRQFGSYTLMFAASIPAIISFNSFVLGYATIKGGSMFPYLQTGEVVLHRKFGAQYGLRRGMLVTFWIPFRPEMMAVKRIVGLPGDVINTRKPYPVPTVVIPPGHVWVEGDGGQQNNSVDSNHYGPVATGLIVGRVTHRFWPLNKIERFRWWEYTGDDDSRNRW